MQIFIRTLTEGTITLNVEVDAKLKDLFYALKDRLDNEGCPGYDGDENSIRIIHAGKEVDLQGHGNMTLVDLFGSELDGVNLAFRRPTCRGMLSDGKGGLYERKKDKDKDDDDHDDIAEMGSCNML